MNQWSKKHSNRKLKCAEKNLDWKIFKKEKNRNELRNDIKCSIQFKTIEKILKKLHRKSERSAKISFERNSKSNIIQTCFKIKWWYDKENRERHNCLKKNAYDFETTIRLVKSIAKNQNKKNSITKQQREMNSKNRMFASILNQNNKVIFALTRQFVEFNVSTLSKKRQFENQRNADNASIFYRNDSFNQKNKNTIKKIKIIKIKNIRIRNIKIRDFKIKNIKNSKIEISKKIHNTLCFTHFHHRQRHSIISILLSAIIVKKRNISLNNALNLKHSRKSKINCFEKRKLKSVRQLNQHNSSKKLVRQKFSW